ncbi:MAG: uracil-DNA glycosylase [Aestuariibacter sp.]
MSLLWSDVLTQEKQSDYFQDILEYVKQQRNAGKVVYPPAADVFNAFKLTEFSDIKVVILGQDPYHGPGQAHGLCFSVLPGVKFPPSLVNIYKELQQDIPGFTLPSHGCLQRWAEQGVLLLNTVLTVEQGQAHSHSKIGWERFTDAVVAQINQHLEGVVFLLWGSHAQKKASFVDRNKHHVLTSVHPSPLSAHRGFFGSKHFSTCNQLLKAQDKAPINWQV